MLLYINFTGDPALLHHLISSKTIDMPSIETLDIAVLKDLANECSMTLPAGASKVFHIFIYFTIKFP